MPALVKRDQTIVELAFEAPMVLGTGPALSRQLDHRLAESADRGCHPAENITILRDPEDVKRRDGSRVSVLWRVVPAVPIAVCAPTRSIDRKGTPIQHPPS